MIYEYLLFNKNMGRKTKEETRLLRRDKILSTLLQENKYLREPKYYKNNEWSWAAWDSWAAKGKAGSCICGCGYYNATLHNRRKNTDKGGKKSWLREVSPHLCSDCVKIVENKTGISFIKF